MGIRSLPSLRWQNQSRIACPNVRAVIDGEICSLDRRGRPQFKNLLFRRGNPPCFFAFDLLTSDGKDLRTERLMDRKQELRRLLSRSPDSPLKYTEYIEGFGLARAYALQSRTSQGADSDAAHVRALAAYQDFLTLWKDADPDIPILKQAKAEYAKLQ